VQRKLAGTQAASLGTSDDIEHGSAVKTVSVTFSGLKFCDLSSRRLTSECTKRNLNLPERKWDSLKKDQDIA
jgi:hypothetical protein